MLQHTIIKEVEFNGKGLHTGQYATMKVLPANENTGIVFRRIDLDANNEIRAIADNVTSTARSTTIACGNASVMTIEHIMSSLYGLGVDNAIIEIDNVEVPILDGSAKSYIEAFRDNIKSQKEERKYINIPSTIRLEDEKTGSYVELSPSDSPSFDVEVDFNSKVLGVQKAHWDFSIPYDKEIGICRTFVFFHELEFLFANNLIKGGDVDNAIVIVEHPVSDESLKNIAKIFNKEIVKINDSGYLDNLELRFPNECGRHKLLDVIGDLALIGGYVNANVKAYKPGHKINTNIAKEIRKYISNE